MIKAINTQYLPKLHAAPTGRVFSYTPGTEEKWGREDCREKQWEHEGPGCSQLLFISVTYTWSSDIQHFGGNSSKLLILLLLWGSWMNLQILVNHLFSLLFHKLCKSRLAMNPVFLISTNIININLKKGFLTLEHRFTSRMGICHLIGTT